MTESSAGKDRMTGISRSMALRIILLLGIVSLCGDVVYEGARSVAGPYLLILGGGAFVVAAVAGFGEFLGYGVRLASGIMADRTRNYWLFTICGYLMIGAIPLLVFAGSWESAAVLLLIERMGKGLRSPAKDAILSHAASGVGRGWGFAIHEAMDQVGAVLGPLLFAASYAASGGYRQGFALLLIPFLILVAALLYARLKVPDPVKLEEYRPGDGKNGNRANIPWFGWYLLFVALLMAGFAVFPLIAFHWKLHAIMTDAEIPLIYALAMGTDALVALAAGRLYDRIGDKVLMLAPAIGIVIPFLAFSGSFIPVILGAAAWGASMGIQETVLRAAVADATHIKKRGTAFGLLNTVYGVAWFGGSMIMGILYEWSIQALILYSMVLQFGALLVLVYATRSMSSRLGAGG